MSKSGKNLKMQKNRHPQGPSRREEGLKATHKMMIFAKERAQKIFLKMVEETVDPDTFKYLVKYINPDIYDDIVNDRGASSLCGYPLCPNQYQNFLGDNLYKIHNNSVYDITDRKNFCSDICYAASEIVKKQISLEPLYVRETAIDTLPNVKLPDLKNLEGLVGKYVDIGGYKDIDATKYKETHSFTSFTEVAENSLKMCAENKEVEDLNKSGEMCEKEKYDESISKDRLKRNIKKMSTVRKENPEPRISYTYCSDGLSAVQKVEHCLREWMTFDSLRFLLGDLYVRGMLEDIGSNWDDFDTTAGMKLGVEAKAKYIALCRKLDEDERDDRAGPNLEGHEVGNRAQQPLPDYRQLQEDAKKQRLKVVSFYEGTDQHEDSRNDSTAMMKEECQASLPLIDCFSQNEWRRSIVLDKFDKYLVPFLPLAKLVESEIKRLIMDLVMTFSLSPSNIIFKPGQWSLITLLALKMLSIRYSAIQHGLQRQEFDDFMKTLLSSFNLDALYLDRFIQFITEIRYILTKSQGTEEISNNTDAGSVVDRTSTTDTLSNSLLKMSVTEDTVESERKAYTELQKQDKTLTSLTRNEGVGHIESNKESTDVNILD
ncbi:RNA polymerase II associated protein 2 [Halocaridina rubra]|uniref:RNA polymerase II subunit B1 CTD phosphatase RPAP2 homolog n=1 Tax=Halocaridina rubra TaxID=373956 RepID=A0AAN8WQD5_HALRR